jgi:hypothetical protein
MLELAYLDVSQIAQVLLSETMGDRDKDYSSIPVDFHKPLQK